jgi:hypothetical protein
MSSGIHISPSLTNLWKIMMIPRLLERLECMQHRRKLDLDIEEVRPDLNVLRNASRELRESVKFKQTLQV